VHADLDSHEEHDGNRLSKAMDAARGGHFPGHPPAHGEYPSTSWYSYDDHTCTCAQAIRITALFCIEPQILRVARVCLMQCLASADAG
jgi:hypothetical protein